jgi:putative tryptophan/tyrosine transport system substrate-binding protein
LHKLSGRASRQCRAAPSPIKSPSLSSTTSPRDEDRLAGFAAELVDLKVDVILTYSSGLYAAKRATSTIPIVFGAAPDVVAMGIVASLAHPGGNITGLTFFYPELMAKRLELLKTVAPSMRRAGVLLPRDTWRWQACLR